MYVLAVPQLHTKNVVGEVSPSSVICQATTGVASQLKYKDARNIAKTVNDETAKKSTISTGDSGVRTAAKLVSKPGIYIYDYLGMQTVDDATRIEFSSDIVLDRKRDPNADSKRRPDFNEGGSPTPVVLDDNKHVLTYSTKYNDRKDQQVTRVVNKRKVGLFETVTSLGLDKYLEQGVQHHKTNN